MISIIFELVPVSVPLLDTSPSPSAFPLLSNIDLNQIPSAPQTSLSAVSKEDTYILDKKALCENLNKFMSTSNPFYVRSSILPTTILTKLTQGGQPLSKNSVSSILHANSIHKQSIHGLIESSLRRINDTVVLPNEEVFQGSSSSLPPALNFRHDLQEAANKKAEENRTTIENLTLEGKDKKKNKPTSRKRKLSADSSQTEQVDQPPHLCETPDWSNLTASQIYDNFCLSKT